MKKCFYCFWEKVLNIGMNDKLSYLDVIRLKILNQQSFFINLIVFILLLKTIFEGENDTWILLIVLGLCSVVQFLNHFQKYLVARLYWTAFFPTMTAAVIIIYGEAAEAEVAFFIFMVTSLILYNNNWFRFGLVFFTLCLFAGSIYYTNNFESPYSHVVDDADKILIFLATALCISTIIHAFFVEVQQHIKELEIKNKNLNKAYEEIERFAYISSHNLKTPVRTIHSFTDLISRQLKKEKDNPVNEYLDFIRQGAQQMQLLITDILEYSKLNQNDSIEMERVDLNQIVYFIRQQLEHISTKPMHIEAAKLPILYSNKTLITAVFQNLMENSVKYNNKEFIHIDISFILKKETIIFHFKDNGIGIAKEYHEKIFGMFERLENSTQYQGTGIGLAMCKKIVQKLGGKIGIKSESNKGSCFWVELPVFNKNLELKVHLKPEPFSPKTQSVNYFT